MDWKSPPNPTTMCAKFSSRTEFFEGAPNLARLRPRLSPSRMVDDCLVRLSAFENRRGPHDIITCTLDEWAKKTIRAQLCATFHVRRYIFLNPRNHAPKELNSEFAVFVLSGILMGVCTLQFHAPNLMAQARIKPIYNTVDF